MSKQIRFVHDGIDTIRFLNFLEEIQIRFITPDGILPPAVISERVLDNMNSFACQFYIISARSDSKQYAFDYRDVTSGVAIEFSNTCKGTPNSRNYESGRIYLRESECGKFDPCLLHLYEKMRLFIKKNYIYSKNSRLYWGKSMLDNTKAKNYNATCQGKIVVF